MTEVDVQGNMLEELARKDFPHIDGHYGAGMPTGATPDHELRAGAPGGSLPYDILSPEAFERLCFHIILAQVRTPRFWGRRGQKQHGIDLILSDGSASIVYQCKHYAAVGPATLKKALATFQRDWIEARPDLGLPHTFVLCTSAELKDTTEWEKHKRKFWDDTGVAVDEWHRDTLDTWLRDQPGIVADVFGDRMAEQFCGRGSKWDLGLFQPLTPGADERVDRYLELRDAGGIIRHTKNESEFYRILDQQGVVLLGGVAGTGKTIAALDLASEFDGGSSRVFYLRPTDTHDVDALFAGIRGRAFRPSIFVLDDCHLAFDRVESVVRRLVATSDARIKLVLTARTPPESMDVLDPEGIEFVNRLRDRGQVIDVVADEARYRAIVGLRKPQWNDPPIDRLMASTGCDLAILDLVLDAAEPVDLENIEKLEDLFPSIIRKVFGGAKVVHAPNLKQLAAIAQFDVPVPTAAFPDPLEALRYAATVKRFVFVGGRPAALAFYHPSAAELVFRLLAWAHGDQDASEVGARECAAVLTCCAKLNGPDYALNDLLPRLLRTHLKLTDDRAMKRTLLSDERMVALIHDSSAHPSVFTLGLATALCRNLKTPTPYAARLADCIEAVALEPAAPEGIGLLGVFLNTLRLADAGAHRALEERVGPSRFRALVAARGTLLDLLRILRSSTDAFSADLLRALQADEVAELIDRMDAEKLIPTLGVAMRELGQRRLPDEPSRSQLQLFEERLGSSRMKVLVAARGTFVDLLRILTSSTEAYAAELWRAFDSDELVTLVGRTIAQQESLGNVNQSLRTLGRRSLPDDPDRTQLHLLEEWLGADGFWRLIEEAGDLNDLAYLLDVLSPAFRSTVVAAKHAPDPDRWITLARRGTFYSLARFARDSLAVLPDETADRFREAVEVTAVDLAARSTWSEIGSSLGKMEDFEDEPLRAFFVAAAEQQISAVHIPDLRFDDYQTATGALSVLWRHRPTERPKIGASLWQLLPSKLNWPRTHRLLIQARFILMIARSEDVSEEDALRVLEAFAPLTPDVTIDPKSARYHALFLWNLFALWFERGRSFAQEFRDLQDETMWERFVEVVAKRHTWRRNEDKLDTLMLAGALAFLVPDLRAQVSPLIQGKVTGIRYLAEMADEKLTFVPAFLAFRGMVLSAHESAIFTRDRVGRLLIKAQDYENRGPAIVHVCDGLRGINS